MSRLGAEREGSEEQRKREREKKDREREREFKIEDMVNCIAYSSKKGPTTVLRSLITSFLAF